MGLLDLLHKDIFLVKEEYDGGGGKVTVVADTVEQVEGLVHSVLWEEIIQLINVMDNNLGGKLFN